MAQKTYNIYLKQIKSGDRLAIHSLTILQVCYCETSFELRGDASCSPMIVRWKETFRSMGKMFVSEPTCKPGWSGPPYGMKGWYIAIAVIDVSSLYTPLFKIGQDTFLDCIEF